MITIKSIPHLNIPLSYCFEAGPALLFHRRESGVWSSLSWLRAPLPSLSHALLERILAVSGLYWTVLAMLLGVAEQISFSEASELWLKGHRIPSQLPRWPRSNSSCSLHCISGSFGEKRQQCQFILVSLKAKSPQGWSAWGPSWWWMWGWNS